MTRQLLFVSAFLRLKQVTILRTYAPDVVFVLLTRPWLTVRRTSGSIAHEQLLSLYHGECCVAGNGGEVGVLPVRSTRSFGQSGLTAAIRSYFGNRERDSQAPSQKTRHATQLVRDLRTPPGLARKEPPSEY